MSVENRDELLPPSWLHEEFFENVLQQYENDNDIKVTNISINSAHMKGDHFGSIMFRCKISYKSPNFTNSKEKSLILKTLPAEDDPRRKILKETNLFETEIDMYTKALPKIEKLLSECGEPTKLAAELIYHSLEPHKVLIFEDLCEAGYNTINDRYLREDEIKMLYRKIAKLHAASFVLSHSEYHECVTKFEDGLFCSSPIMDLDFMNGGINNFLEMLSKDDELKVYWEKVKIMEPEMMKRCKILYQAYKLHKTASDIFVLNHGDLHMKNLMFKFNADHQMDDLIMVDYQISCFAPSTIDLGYTQYLIMCSELRYRRNEFMFYYFQEFIRLLKKMNLDDRKLPLYSDMQIAGLRYRHFFLFLLATFLPHVHMALFPSKEKILNVDVDKYIENPEIGIIAYQKQEFIDEMRRFLPRLLFDGYLD